ncbi:leucine efflux protein LeuE [Planosporangium mesophilum]|nr:leucine efflux protein LeuE [Planosporangium mesophilum]NJC84389.1 leucine efflux protein LeuE [Planosporangium mesophilum]
MITMLGITNVWTYLLGTAAIILLPGPNSMYVLSTAARRGVRAGYAGACGVFLGDAVLMTLSAAGVASLLRAQPALFMVVKYAGAGYLCWIGFGLLRAAWRRWRNPAARAAAESAARAAAEPSDERGPFRRALLVSLLNPKAILFFISFFIQFVQPGYAHPWVPFLILGAIAELISAAYLTALIFTGSYLAAQFRRRRALSSALTTGVGVLFVGFALKLATASL